MKKLLAILCVSLLCLGLLVFNVKTSGDPPVLTPWDVTTATQGTNTPPSPQPEEPQPPAQIRIRNADPELETAWRQLGRQYTQLTGVEVVVFSENDAQSPTLYTVTDGEAISPEKCVDLSATTAFSQLADMGLALKVDGKYCGICMEIDCFGLIFNGNLLAEMVTQEEIRDINGFRGLVNGIAAKGYAPFSGRSLTTEVATYLASIPGNYRTVAQLWSQNATDSGEITPLERFLSGESVFYLGSTNSYDTMVSGGIDVLGILPIFLDQSQDIYLQQSLCVKAEKYWCVNAEASPEDVAATLDFLDWLVSTGEDGTVPVDSLGILAPYRQAKFYANPLENTLRQDLAAGKTPVVCKNLTAPPVGFAEALTAFVQDPTDENWLSVAAFLQ